MSKRKFFFGVLLPMLIFCNLSFSQKTEYAVISKNKSNLENFDDNSLTSLMGILSYNINRIPYFLEENGYQGCYDINQLRKLNLDETGFIKFIIRPKFLLPRTFSQDTIPLQKTAQTLDVFFDSMLVDPDNDLLNSVDRKQFKNYWDSTNVDGLIRMSYNYYFDISNITTIVFKKVDGIEWIYFMKQINKKQIPVLSLKKEQLLSICKTFYFEPNSEQQKNIISFLKTSQLKQYEYCKGIKPTSDNNCLGDYCSYADASYISSYIWNSQSWGFVNPFKQLKKPYFICDSNNYKLKQLFFKQQTIGDPWGGWDYYTSESFEDTNQVFLIKTDLDFNKSVKTKANEDYFKELYFADPLFKKQFELTALNDTVRREKLKGIFWAEIENPQLAIEYELMQDSTEVSGYVLNKKMLIYQPQGNQKNIVMLFEFSKPDSFYNWNYDETLTKEVLSSIDSLLYKQYNSVFKNISAIDKTAYSSKIDKNTEKSLKYIINY
jgi:hypothetical protein